MATKLSVKAIVGMVVVAVLAGFAVADARDTDTSGRSRAALTVMANDSEHFRCPSRSLRV